MESSGQSPSPQPAPPVGEGRALDLAAWICLGIVTGVWAWWALAEGAWFTSVFNPGALVLCATFGILLWVAPWRGDAGLSVPVRLATLGLAGLAAWTLASLLWTPAPDVAVGDAQRLLVYLIAFGLGAWTCNLLGRHMIATLAPVVVAGAITAAVTFVQMLTGNDPLTLLEIDGTLDFPLGYRNANAAYFMIAAWPAICLAAERGLPLVARLGSAAAATACIEAAILSQSRGSAVAAVAGLIVLVIAARRRWRILAWVALTVLPAALVYPAAHDLFTVSTAAGSPAGATVEMNDAGMLALLGAGLSMVIALLAVWADRFLPERSSREGSKLGRNTGIAAVAILAGVVVAAFAFGGAGGWIGDRVDEFRNGEPDLSDSGSRFTFNAGSNRSDLWRVATDAVADDPLFGDGAGGYPYRYLAEREQQYQVAHDAHSVELETVSELGVPGLILLLLTLTGAFVAAWRSRNLGPAAAVLSCAALASGAYWFAHASLDWFWPYPALTAPVLFMFGAAAAPALRTFGAPARRTLTRALLGVAVAVLALTLIPLFMAERYLNRAYAVFRSDPQAATEALDRAETLNPLSDAPLLARGAIARELGDREAAIEAFTEASQKRPEEWAGPFFLAEMYADSDPARARAQLAIVKELNPLSDQIEPLEQRIAATEQGEESGSG